MDRMIGELLAELDEAGLTDDTLICYMSDHGEQAGERGLWCATSQLEGDYGSAAQACGSCSLAIGGSRPFMSSLSVFH
eukprot:SAG31_NODE_3006_length_4794_cov_3.365495_9_plen_78_part_00